MNCNNCINKKKKKKKEKKKRKPWYVLKPSAFENFKKIKKMIRVFEVEEQISIGKCIKLCFHIQIFSVNCVCLSFNSLFTNVIAP